MTDVRRVGVLAARVVQWVFVLGALAMSLAAMGAGALFASTYATLAVVALGFVGIVQLLVIAPVRHDDRRAGR